MTYRECYAYGCEILEKAQIADAKLDARLLLEFVCHTTQHDLILNGSRPLSEMQQVEYEALIAKRSQRIPLQHITGEQEFMGFVFQVNEHVLIPRQDTEILVEEVLNVLKPGMKVLDMCTGSGCILLSLLALTKDCEGIGADISVNALKVAKENLKSISAQCGRKLSAKFVESNLFEQFVQEKFDVIVSNPPYIASAVIETLEPEVRLHEPTSALDGTEDGLYFYRKIVTDSKNFLKKGGALLFEIGHDQGEAVANLLSSHGFKDTKVIKDLAGKDRVVCGRWQTA